MAVQLARDLGAGSVVPVTDTAELIHNDLALPGWAQLLVCGELLVRHEGDWRDAIDLATADRATVYAAGQADGYRQAWAEIEVVRQVLVDWLEIMSIECLECCTCGRKLRHPKAKADGLFPDCDLGWPV